jgi:RimJ/RimL family protein N-acetyltransferase
VHDSRSIETDRLILRCHTVADFDDSAAMWGDAAVTRYIGDRPFTREEVWARLLRYHGHWSILGYGYWVVRDKASARFVGEVGFADYKRDIPIPIDAPEAGWALAPWAHGQGFATEAMTAVIAWGDVHFAKGKTMCLIDPRNLASLRVADKLGYRETWRTTYHGDPTIICER